MVGGVGLLDAELHHHRIAFVIGDQDVHVAAAGLGLGDHGCHVGAGTVMLDRMLGLGGGGQGAEKGEGGDTCPGNVQMQLHGFSPNLVLLKKIVRNLPRKQSARPV